CTTSIAAKPSSCSRPPASTSTHCTATTTGRRPAARRRSCSSSRGGASVAPAESAGGDRPPHSRRRRHRRDRRSRRTGRRGDHRRPHHRCRRRRGPLARAMDEGAIGLASGLIYPPSAYGTTDELAALCAVVQERGGLYASHIRNEGDRLLEAVEENLEIGRRSHVRVQLSHHKASGPKNWGRVKESTA